MALEQPATAGVLGVVGVIGGIQRTGVDDQRAVSSDRRISSIRWETVLLPLRPGVPRRRPRTRPMRWLSIASRVTSDSDIPRLSAS